MKRNYLLIFSITATLSLAGCQSNQTNTDTEALQEQITQLQQQISELEQTSQLQQQISELEQELPTRGALDTPRTQVQQDAENDPSAPAASEKDQTGDSAALSTTHTMEELTTMVSDFEEKVNAAVPSGSAADDIEQFLAFKQEEETIDDDLDLYENELENLYRSNALSQDEYRTLEQELERLEDRLDAAEDKLEYTFGIDD